VFYADSPFGFSGVCSIVHKSLSSTLGFSHASGRTLLVNISVRNHVFSMVNVYANNNAKERADLWDANGIYFVNPWCLFGDFSMVLERSDRVGPTSFFTDKEKSSWNALMDKWALVDAWSLGCWSSKPGHWVVGLLNLVILIIVYSMLTLLPD